MTRLISAMGSPALRTLVTGLGAIMLYRRRQRREAAFLMGTVGGAGLFNSAIKKLVGRSRPFGAGSDGASFPSGHATGAVALAGTGAYLVHRHLEEPAGALVATLGVAWAALVGWSRVSQHEHHPGDIFGGYILGGMWLASAISVFQRRARQRRVKR